VDEVQEWCPVECKCEVTVEESITADCSNQNYTSVPNNFPKLNSLNFSHNMLNGVRNVDFQDKNLLDIEHIDLSNNKISNIETQSFEHLTKLQYLNMSSNTITNVSSEAFKKLGNLKTLDLRGNNINCTLLKNALPLVNTLCDNIQGNAYDTTKAAEVLTKANDGNMLMSTNTYATDIPKVNTDDTMMATATKASINNNEVHITTSTENYITLFGMTQITHEVVAADVAQNKWIVATATSLFTILILLLGIVIFILCHRHRYRQVKTESI
jgi:hypothetical protein